MTGAIFKLKDKLQRTSLATMLKVSGNVVEPLEQRRIFQETVDGAATLFRWGTAAIYLFEPGESGTNRIRLHATYPELPPDFPDALREMTLDENPHMAHAIRSRASLLIKDALAVELTETEKIVVKERNLRTLLFVPIIAGEEVYGAFIVGSSLEPVEISDGDEEMANAYARFSALAIHNARMYEEKEAYIQMLELAIAEREEEKFERKKLQGELFQMQKLEAVGQLAGGVAHDVNNQLGGILAYAELLQLDCSNPQLKSNATQIVALTKRAADINSRLLTFARRGTPRITAVDIDRIVQEVVGILTRTVSKRIQVRYQSAGNQLFTRGDPAQIQNAVLNLGINGRDAMENGGTLTFTTSVVEIDEDDMQADPFRLSAGKYVCVSVADTGIGMDSDTMQKMYEPFFTTKSREKGTGIGLSAVFGTMKIHNGGIRVESTPNEGTTFHLLFSNLSTTAR